MGNIKSAKLGKNKVKIDGDRKNELDNRDEFGDDKVDNDKVDDNEILKKKIIKKQLSVKRQ